MKTGFISILIASIFLRQETFGANTPSTLSVKFLSSNSSQTFCQLFSSSACGIAALTMTVTETALSFLNEQKQIEQATSPTSNFSNGPIVFHHSNGLAGQPFVKVSVEAQGYLGNVSSPQSLCNNKELGAIIGSKDSTVNCNGLILAYTISYTCVNGSDYYGWGCQNCDPVNKTSQCYTCSSNGNPICCSSSFNASNSCVLIPTTVPPPSTSRPTSLSSTPVGTSPPNSSSLPTNTPSTSSTTTPNSLETDLKIYRYLTYGLAALAGLFILFLLILSCCLCKYYRKAEKEAKNPYRDPTRYRQTSPKIYSTTGDRVATGGGAYYKPPSVTSTEDPPTPTLPPRMSNVRDNREQELLDRLYSQPIPRENRPVRSRETSDSEDDYQPLASTTNTFDYQSAYSHPTSDARGDPPPYPFRSSASDHPVTYV